MLMINRHCARCANALLAGLIFQEFVMKQTRPGMRLLQKHLRAGVRTQQGNTPDCPELGQAELQAQREQQQLHPHLRQRLHLHQLLPSNTPATSTSAPLPSLALSFAPPIDNQ